MKQFLVLPPERPQGKPGLANRTSLCTATIASNLAALLKYAPRSWLCPERKGTLAAIGSQR
ncbi:MAG: hypothetical protein AAF291_09390 [Pseudomonadota bacterium]